MPGPAAPFASRTVPMTMPSKMANTAPPTSGTGLAEKPANDGDKGAYGNAGRKGFDAGHGVLSTRKLYDADNYSATSR